MGTKTITQRIAQLRENRRQLPDAPQRAAHALAQVASLWRTRLDNGWTPPPGSAFPWAMVRRSLEALVDGWVVCPSLPAPPPHPEGQGERGILPILALILAGNTPLLAWPALTAALAAGVPLFVKLSREESLWTQLFVEALAEIDGEVAGLVDRDVWPGEDGRTAALIQAADAVVAYGSDSTIAALRQLTPEGNPFYGFGHAISIGISLPGRKAEHSWEGFASDTLMYGQQGCLSPQTIFVIGDAEAAREGAEHLVGGMKLAVDALEVPPVTDPSVAFAVRTARDMAAFAPSTTVYGDAELRWTIIAHHETVPVGTPTGYGVVNIIPVQNFTEEWGTLLGPLRGKVSAVGYNGQMTPPLEKLLLGEGITYLCAAGQMQTPPLDWPNAHIDLVAEMRRLSQQTV